MKERTFYGRFCFPEQKTPKERSVMKATMFAQTLQLLPWTKIQQTIDHYEGDKHSKGLRTADQLRSMLYSQLSGSSSLSEICNGLKSYGGLVNHMGISHVPGKSTLSYANKNRNWEMFAGAYWDTLEHFQKCLRYHGIKPRRLNIKNKLKIMDSSLLPVCLDVIDWAAYRQKKGALKLHMLLDGHGLLPDDSWITDGKAHDLEFAREQKFEPGTVILVDRGYNDYTLYDAWHASNCFFVTRLKKNAVYEVLEQREVPKSKTERIISDQVIQLKGTRFRARRIEFYDEEKDEYTQILTNNLKFAADTIGQLYRLRWEIEIFFRDLKQNFHIKSFVGTTPNAVLIQIWTALLAILIAKFMKMRAAFNWSFSNLIALFRVNLLNRMDLDQWLNEPFRVPEEEPDIEQPFLAGMGFGQHEVITK